jgi:hypothetical protein
VARRDLVTVTHPNIEKALSPFAHMIPDITEQRVAGLDADLRVAELAGR